MSSQFDGYEPWQGKIPKRTNGAIVSDREGETVAYGLFDLQERGDLFVGAGVPVYEGMICGENAHPLDVNVCRAKKMTNIRTVNKDENVVLTTPREMSLEKALEWINEDELVEVTPSRCGCGRGRCRRGTGIGRTGSASGRTGSFEELASRPLWIARPSP